jgi:hypothetical protein
MIRTVLPAAAILTVFTVTVWYQHGGRHQHAPQVVDAR